MALLYTAPVGHSARASQRTCLTNPKSIACIAEIISVLCSATILYIFLALKPIHKINFNHIMTSSLAASFFSLMSPLSTFIVKGSVTYVSRGSFSPYSFFSMIVTRHNFFNVRFIALLLHLLWIYINLYIYEILLLVSYYQCILCKNVPNSFQLFVLTII